MTLSTSTTSNSLFTLLFILIFSSFATQTLASLYTPPKTHLSYHHGPLLRAQIPITILFYGPFTPAQKSIISDFFLSLTPHKPPGSAHPNPSASTWWKTVENYLTKAGQRPGRVVLSGQVTDEGYSLGKFLTRDQIESLARKVGSGMGGVAVVLTAEDVAVEGFCMSSCGYHGSYSGPEGEKRAFIWVGNSAGQCPGQCAWPFHQPIYGPQGPALVAPNGDVGVDGMVVNIAGILANTVTNPFGDGYYQGPDGAPMEVASACTGMYGTGAYPGYAGRLLVDSGSGGSYNAVGVSGRKFLLPALFDPLESRCWTLV